MVFCKRSVASRKKGLFRMGHKQQSSQRDDSFMLSCCPAGLIDSFTAVCFKEFRNSISIDHSVPSLSYRTLLIHNPSYRGCFRTQDILFIGNYRISFSTKTKQSAASFEYKNNASITPSKYCPIRRRRITVLLTVGYTG